MQKGGPVDMMQTSSTNNNDINNNENKGSDEKKSAAPPCLCLVIAEPEALPLGEWVRSLVAESLAPPVTHLVLHDVGEPSADELRLHTAALQALETVLGDCMYSASDNNNNNNNNNSNNNNNNSTNSNSSVNGGRRKVVCLVIAVLWDGQSESVKAEFKQLRQLTDVSKNSTASGSGNTHPKDRLQFADVQFVLQALNAKKGEHTLKENSEALISTIRKKLTANSSAQYTDPHNSETLKSSTEKKTTILSLAMGSSSEAKGTVIGKEDLSEESIAACIAEGQGECFVLISGHDMKDFQRRVAQLKASAEKLGAGCRPLMEEPREVPTVGNVVNTNENNGNSGGDSAGGSSNKSKIIAQEFILRQSSSEQHFEIRLAMCGNVDSGKSTLTSVLTRGCRDNGRGFARSFVFRHKHEETTGRTSSVSENHLGFSSTGEVVNYTVAAARRHGGNNSSGGGSSAVARAQLVEEVVEKSAKILTLYDLAGHERYLKTTVLGMTRNMPDYGCVVISANNGIQRMTKEHIALCLALKIPFFIVVTRIDSTPENVRQETLASIHKLLKIPTVRKYPLSLRRAEDIVLAAKRLRSDSVVPIFEVSNVTGDGVRELLRFLDLLPMRKDWRTARALPQEMVIDSTFFVTGVGTVVGGIVTQGVFRVNDVVLLGPDTAGAYRAVHIKSIHVKGREQQEAVAGCDASFCLKKERRSAIRKGNILTDARHAAVSYWQFEADVTILYHSTTILVNYEPVIHSTTVRQSARIVYVAQEVLRTGDRSLVRFHFLYRPEFMKVGQQLIFREGRTKGIGTVTKVMTEAEPSRLVKKRVVHG